MQLSAVLNIFIVKTKLNSIFTNDLKRKYFFFRKMFIVTDLVSLSVSKYFLSNTFSHNIDNCSGAFSLLFSIYVYIVCLI